MQGRLTLRLAVCTFAHMDGHETGNPIWVAVGPDVAAGYELDLLGDYSLRGLVIYEPTTSKLRSARLRDLSTVIDGADIRGLRRAEPPSAGELRQMWEREQHPAVFTPTTHPDSPPPEVRQAEANRLATLDLLTRKPDDSPDDFYARVVAAHEALSWITPRPTSELARRAGVPSGTAAAWVSRAKLRQPRLEEGDAEIQAKLRQLRALVSGEGEDVDA